MKKRSSLPYFFPVCEALEIPVVGIGWGTPSWLTVQSLTQHTCEAQARQNAVSSEDFDCGAAGP